MDLAQLLWPELPLEMLLRGTVMYLSIYMLLRVVSRRELGETGATNIVLIVLIADAAQNALSGEYTTIGDGLILVTTILAWAVLLDAAAYRWRWFARLARPPSVLLVDDGRPVHRNLRRELMPEEELLAQLRQHGVHRLADAEAVWMETDGRISVIARERSPGR